MAITYAETLETFPRIPVGAEPFPLWLADLDVDTVHSLRGKAQEYGALQADAAMLQEEAVRQAGFQVQAHEYTDTFTNAEDREFVDTIIESMIGIRLEMGDEAVYAGDRTKGLDNPLTETVKYLSPAIAYWRANLVPTAGALSVLYNPELPLLPGTIKPDVEGFIPGQDNDIVGSKFFAECLDGRAIRSRGDAVRTTYLEHFMDTKKYPVGSEINVASLACGAAEVVFEATAELQRVRPDLKINVTLADQDVQALERARLFAESKEELQQINFTYTEANILSPKALAEMTVATHGKGFDFIDIVGFLEYLPARTAKRFMSLAYDMVGQDGLLCAANMRDTHEQLEFTTNCVRWPYIIPRSLPTLATMTEEACDLKPSDVTMVLPTDGAYTLVNIKKSSQFA